MSTPTNRQAEKERQPGAKQTPSVTKGQGTPVKRASTTPQAGRADQKPAQKAVTRADLDTKAVSEAGEKTKTSPEPKPTNSAAAKRDERLEQRRAEIQARQQERRRELQQSAPSPAPRPASQPAAKAATPPAPKPRDPSVARRDERREQRRAEIQARQQERRRELQQAKRQKISIRYSIIVAAVLFVGLVSFFSFEHAWLATAISAAAVLLVEFAFLAVMTVTTPKRAGYRPRSSAAVSANLAPLKSDTAGEKVQEAPGLPQDAPEDAPAQETAERTS
ncbi:MAG TPA: hypothetical protein VFU32_07915 [Ktedonobacterales bacterium]|nr:hypothetical protein [Ktedonobacterales bacterium]